MDLKRVADVLAERAREAHEWNIASGLECGGVLGDCPREVCKEAVAALAEVERLTARVEEPQGFMCCCGRTVHWHELVEGVKR